MKLKVYKVLYTEEFAPEVAIKRARSRVGEIKVDLWARMEFVRWAKTGSNEALQDNCTLLRREKVESAMQLKRGDHVERPLHNLGGLMGYFHHMLVLQPLDDRHCEVVHCHTGHHGVTGSSIRRETIDIFEAGKVSRVKYTERIDPEEGITQLLKVSPSCFCNLV